MRVCPRALRHGSRGAGRGVDMDMGVHAPERLMTGLMEPGAARAVLMLGDKDPHRVFQIWSHMATRLGSSGAGSSGFRGGMRCSSSRAAFKVQCRRERWRRQLVEWEWDILVPNRTFHARVARVACKCLIPPIRAGPLETLFKQEGRTKPHNRVRHRLSWSDTTPASLVIRCDGEVRTHSAQAHNKFDGTKIAFNC